MDEIAEDLIAKIKVASKTRMRNAEKGWDELKKFADTIISAAGHHQCADTLGLTAADNHLPRMRGKNACIPA